MCSWSFSDSWRHLKWWTKTSPVSNSALSIYPAIKSQLLTFTVWPCDISKQRGGDDRKMSMLRIPPFFIYFFWIWMLLNRILAFRSGAILPAVCYRTAISNASLWQRPCKNRLIIAHTERWLKKWRLLPNGRYILISRTSICPRLRIVFVLSELPTCKYILFAPRVLQWPVFTLRRKTLKSDLEFPFLSPPPVMDWQWALLLIPAATVGPFTVSALWRLTERGHFWAGRLSCLVPRSKRSSKGTGHYHFKENPSEASS